MKCFQLLPYWWKKLPINIKKKNGFQVGDYWFVNWFERGQILIERENWLHGDIHLQRTWPVEKRLLANSGFQHLIHLTQDGTAIDPRLLSPLNPTHSTALPIGLSIQPISFDRYLWRRNIIFLLLSSCYLPAYVMTFQVHLPPSIECCGQQMSFVKCGRAHCCLKRHPFCIINANRFE